MTQDPSCCLPSDAVNKAAQLMKTETVGAIPVIDRSSLSQAQTLMRMTLRGVRRLADALEAEKTFEIQDGGERIYVPPYAVIEFEYRARRGF